MRGAARGDFAALRRLLPQLAALALVLPLGVDAARAQARAAGKTNVVVLDTTRTRGAASSAALPPEIRSRTLYWRQIRSRNGPRYELCLGFFDTRAEAERARARAAARYPRARVIAVSMRERDSVLKKLASAAQAAPRAAAAAPAPAAAASAARLMAEGRAAITREDYAAAIGAFTRLLALPENPLTRDALEFRALSYERSGNAAQARREYQRYLERYPEGPDAARVRQRLANLRPPAHPETLRRPAQRAARSRWDLVGGLSQFYYRGNSRIDSQPAGGNPLDRTTLSITDQSALITNLDLNARYSDDAYDHRFVFRDTNLRNFVAGQQGRNRLNAAYYDFRDRPADLAVRMGRQPGNGAGLLGRFDGAEIGYGVRPGLRLNVVGGQPVAAEGAAIDSRQGFIGLNADIGPLRERWSGNVFYVRQYVDGIVDRSATGMELRYTAPRGSLFSMVDYDTMFRHVNVFTLQGNWTAPSKTSYSFMADYRMTPTLQTSTAVIGEATTSVKNLLETYTAEELRLRARALTARMAMGYLGVTTPVSRGWQVGADFRVMRISHTDGTPDVPGTPGSGYIYTLTGQAIGTGLFAARDVNLFSVSRVEARTYEGLALRYVGRLPFRARWSLEGSALWYEQSNTDGSTLDRVAPALRASYRQRRDVTLEAEAGIEFTDQVSPLAEEKTRRSYFSLGYRWDF